MNKQLDKKEWQKKLYPKLVAIDGVNDVETGVRGIIVRTEREDKKIEQDVMDLLEIEAPDLPYRCMVTRYTKTGNGRVQPTIRRTVIND